MAALLRSAFLDLCDIEKETRRRLGSRVCDLNLRETGNGIVISGNASTYYAKQMAQQVAMELSNKPVHANQIIVTAGGFEVGRPS